MIQLLTGRRSHSGTGGRRKCLLASLAALMLLVSACSSSKRVSSTTANAPNSSPSAPNSSPSTSAGDIKVMVIAPFTLAAQPSKANYDAVRIQADLQNARGGINGHKVVVI